MLPCTFKINNNTLLITSSFYIQAFFFGSAAKVSPEQSAAAASGSSSSPTPCPKTNVEQKNAAEIEHFKLFNPQKQREYLDSKQQYNQSIVHLIPFFRGETPKEPQLAFASIQEVEQEKRRHQMESDGLYLLNCIKVSQSPKFHAN